MQGEKKKERREREAMAKKRILPKRKHSGYNAWILLILEVCNDVQ